MAAVFFDRSKFSTKVLKRVTQGTILSNYFKIWQAVSEEKNFEEFLWSPHSEKKPPPPKFWKEWNKEQSCETISNSPAVSSEIFKEFL